ncbi:MaoC family dehydratase N-terminal domain-containing protein [Chloroflexota bacterium]
MKTEEVTRLTGKVGEVSIMEVERGAIKKYADAVGDTNPLYWDEERARHSRYSSIVAPPGFFGWPTMLTGAMPLYSKLRSEMVATLAQYGYSRILDGGIEYEFFRPVQAGDTLAALDRIIDVSEREGKTGKMVLAILETTYTNQKGNLVARARQTTIFR